MQIATPSAVFATLANVEDVVMLVPAYGDNYGDCPDYGVIRLDMNLLTTLEKLAGTVKALAADSINYLNADYSVEEWSPCDSTIVNDSMSVSADSFWFTGCFKHGGGTVDTAAISLAELTKALLGQSSEFGWNNPAEGSAKFLVPNPSDEEPHAWVEDYLRRQYSEISA